MENTPQSTRSASMGAPNPAAANEIVTSIQRRSQSAKAAALTRKRRDQLFDEAAADMVPERAPAPIENPLQSWWPQIKRKLDQGFSARQVHELMCAPKINLGMGLRTLQRFIKTQQTAAADTEAKAEG